MTSETAATAAPNKPMALGMTSPKAPKERKQPFGAVPGKRKLPDYRQAFKDDPLKVILVKHSELVIDPARSGRVKPRTEAQIKEKMETLAQEGQLVPCSIELGPEGEPILVHGFGRVEALKRLGKPIKVMLWDSKAEGDTFIKGLHANIKNDALTPLDFQAAIHRLKQEPFNMKAVDISRRLSVSRATITQHAKLDFLIPDSREALSTGVISLKIAEDLANIEDPKEQKEALKELLKTVDKAGRVVARHARKVLRPKLLAKKRKNAKGGQKSKKNLTRELTIVDAKDALATIGKQTKSVAVALVVKTVLAMVTGKIEVEKAQATLEAGIRAK